MSHESVLDTQTSTYPQVHHRHKEFPPSCRAPTPYHRPLLGFPPHLGRLRSPRPLWRLCRTQGYIHRAEDMQGTERCGTAQQPRAGGLGRSHAFRRPIVQECFCSFDLGYGHSKFVWGDTSNLPHFKRFPGRRFCAPCRKRIDSIDNPLRPVAVPPV